MHDIRQNLHGHKKFGALHLEQPSVEGKELAYVRMLSSELKGVSSTSWITAFNQTAAFLKEYHIHHTSGKLESKCARQ